MGAIRITERRLHDTRFRKTEEAIIRVFFNCGGKVTLAEIANEIGVARSTIYRHHRSIREIMADYREYIVEKYNSVMSVLLKRNARLRKIYAQMLIFIVQNRNVFLILFRDGDREVLINFIESLKPKIIKTAKLPRNCDKIFLIYTREIIALMERWGESGFKEDGIDEILLDILYLTETIRTRLGRLADR